MPDLLRTETYVGLLQIDIVMPRPDDRFGGGGGIGTFPLILPAPRNHEIKQPPSQSRWNRIQSLFVLLSLRYRGPFLQQIANDDAEMNAYGQTIGT